MKKRVLLLATSAGSGHITAAQALEKVFRQSPQVEAVVHKDALDFTNQAFRDFYSEFFQTLVKRNPHFLGWWYDESDEPWRTDQVRSLMDRLNLQPMVKFIKEFRPDIVVCTHYLPAGIVSHLLATGQLDTQLAIVTTDYDFHSQWLSRWFHRYFVALEQTKAHLIMLGIPAERITVSGIPIDPVFGAPVDRAAVLKKYQFQPNRPILVLSAGAIGGGPVRGLVEQLLLLHNEAQCVVICGKNEQLRMEIEALVVTQAERFRVLGFTNDMADLMRVATLFIGKPGGLTISEVMAAGVPMLIGTPTPGQEDRNSDHLLENGVAIKYNDLTVVAYKIDKLLRDPVRLEQMRANTSRLRHPDAARTIVETLLSDQQLPPMEITRAVQQRMVAAMRGAVLDPAAPIWAAGEIALFSQQTGVLLGSLSEAQLAFLASHLEEESAIDEDYYINEATVEGLRLAGADADLIDMLERAIAYGGEADIRLARR